MVLRDAEHLPTYLQTEFGSGHFSKVSMAPTSGEIKGVMMAFLTTSPSEMMSITKTHEGSDSGHGSVHKGNSNCRGSVPEGGQQRPRPHLSRGDSVTGDRSRVTCWYRDLAPSGATDAYTGSKHATTIVLVKKQGETDRKKTLRLFLLKRAILRTVFRGLR